MKKYVQQVLYAFLVSIFIAQPAFTSDQESFYGKWGTEAQCSAELITENGTKRAAPFEVRPDWLGHGDVWCRLNWVYLGSTPGGIFALTKALCGEDSTRDYQIKFELNGDELTLVWDTLFKNGPLMRCM